MVFVKHILSGILVMLQLTLSLHIWCIYEYFALCFQVLFVTLFHECWNPLNFIFVLALVYNQLSAEAKGRRSVDKKGDKNMTDGETIKSGFKPILVHYTQPT